MNVPLSHLECQQEAFIVLIGLGIKIAASAPSHAERVTIDGVCRREGFDTYGKWL
jgi:hypothetical protein